MLDDIICLYERIKELLEYVNGPADQQIKNEISAILDAEEAERNETISQIAIEHNYSKSDGVDGNNNTLLPLSHCHAMKVELNPSSEIYNLRIRTGSAYNRNCSCCNGPQLCEHPVKR